MIEEKAKIKEKKKRKKEVKSKEEETIHSLHRVQARCTYAEIEKEKVKKRKRWVKKDGGNAEFQKENGEEN